MAVPHNYITEDTTIKGNLTTASSLTVAGAIEGDVNAGGEVVILSEAVIRGDVSGPDISIEGQVEGRVTASGRLLIKPSGQVHGNISVRSLLIEEGGTLQGECHMGEAVQSAPVPAPNTAGNGRAKPPPPPIRRPDAE